MSIFAALLPIFNSVIGLIPDPKQRAESMNNLVIALQEWDAQQNRVNAEEAKSSSLFIAGWRPAIGWCCAIAIAYQYLVIPFATWGFAVHGTPIPPFPTLDTNMWELTFGMLGMGGLRTLEKVKGVTGKKK